MFSAQANPLTLARVSLGTQKIFVPVADLHGKAAGKTLLLTAGMDGNEYESIEALYTLIAKYKTKEFVGRLIILPIVNIPGFEAECAENPLDATFPKHIYPGLINGTQSERLLHWLTTSYIKDADAWVDLHGGSTTESLLPFAWMYVTGVKSLDTQAQDWYQTSGAKYVVFEKAKRGWRANLLAQQNCLYFEIEAGARGALKPENISQHITWIEVLMQQLGMIDMPPAANKHEPFVFDGVHKVTATHGGLLHPMQAVGQTVSKGDILCVTKTYDLSQISTITAPTDGVILWRKDTLALRKGDTLFGIGYKNKPLLYPFF